MLQSPPSAQEPTAGSGRLRRGGTPFPERPAQTPRAPPTRRRPQGARISAVTRPSSAQRGKAPLLGARAKRPRTAQRRQSPPRLPTERTATTRTHGYRYTGGARPRRRKSRAGAPKRTRTARQAGAAVRPTATTGAPRAGGGGRRSRPTACRKASRGLNRLAVGVSPKRLPSYAACRSTLLCLKNTPRYAAAYIIIQLRLPLAGI